MELISKISKGSRMDQVYIPKKRIGFAVGTYVILRQVQEMPMQKAGKAAVKPFFYNIAFLEPIKIKIINEIFENIENFIGRHDNIIITGSFLENGFNFNDIDVVLVSGDKVDKGYLENLLRDKTGIDVHITLIDNTTLVSGLNSDPLYQTMLSKCVSRRRFVYRLKPEINYKVLDLHLLKSKLLAENFDFLSGREKYELVRNAAAIALFLENKHVSKDRVDGHIDKLFGKGMSRKIKENIITDKKDFLGKYKKFYEDLFLRVLEGVKNGPKQK